MTRTRRSVALAGLALLLPAPAAMAGAGPVPLTITAAPGCAGGVAQALGASALRVVRRDRGVMQVIASVDRLPALRLLPGVVTAHAAASSMPAEDPEDSPGGLLPSEGIVESEGIERVGADALKPLAHDGEGVLIAVLDLGFGSTSRIADLQRRRELPPSSRLETATFDPAWGLHGRNAYGNATNHGELVAQTVFDFAPGAGYLFVNYHTEQDFQTAVEWLIQRRPDVVVHSNNFLEGPFDGSSPAAQAVDRAAAAGIAWVNSAGNYAQRHWEGAWSDADDDDVLDWPGTPGWTFDVAPNSPITFALSWDQPDGAEVTDLDLVVERRATSGEWAEVAASRDPQGDGARPAERVTGVPSVGGGEFRVQVVLTAGPPPSGPVTLFSREVAMDALGDSGPGSIPTPGDAEGSITVGAVGWTGNSLRAYSSQGPTDDGRLKPDITAPTNTRVLTASGPRSIGGTSNAAPNAAGAIALLIGARRRAGAPLDLVALGDLLSTQALDLGASGPDNRFGAGRVRVDVDAPEVTFTTGPGRVVATVPVRLRASAEDASRLAEWSVTVDGRVVIRHWGESAPLAVLGRRLLPDGWHTLTVRARDWPGNEGVRTRVILVDTAPPRLWSLDIERAGWGSVRGVLFAVRDRPARLRVTASDLSASRLRIVVTGSDGREVRRLVMFQGTAERVIPLGFLLPGPYRVTVTAVDAVGHTRTTTRPLRLAP